MKQVALCLLILFSLQSAALSDLPTSIFDDDWKPDVPKQVPPPAAEIPAASATTKPASAVTRTPTPTPPTTDPAVIPVPAPAAPPAPVVTRLAVPTAAAQASSWKLIKTDLYKDDIANAKTPTQKVELACKLLAVAHDTNKDPVGKYVLLTQAKALAISSGDPPTAFKCLNELGEVYDINYPVMKLELFAALAKTVSTPADCKTLVDGLNRWADGQVRSDRYDAANRACEIAETAARANKDTALVNQTALHQKQIAEIEVGYISSKPTIQTLASKPTDPGVNLAAGRFYCFIKGDWGKGLPMLALGDDVGLKALAAKELAGISGADAQVELGDGWWALAEKEEGLKRSRIQEHATEWYEEALPSLEGLARVKVEKRLKEAELLSGHGLRIVNLLNLVDVQRDAVKGVWRMEHGALVSDGSGFSRIGFPYEPPREYDFRITFKRAGGVDAVTQICTSPRQQFDLTIGGWAGTLCGFELVDGAWADKNPTGKKATKWLNDGQENTSVVKVRTTGIEAYLNGKLICAWRTDFSDISHNDAWSLKRKDVVGVGSFESPTVFRTIEVVEITGKGKTLAEGDSGGK